MKEKKLLIITLLFILTFIFSGCELKKQILDKINNLDKPETKTEILGIEEQKSDVVNKEITNDLESKNKDTTNTQKNLNETIASTTTKINSSTDEIDISDWLTYRNEEYGFEVKYPREWEIKDCLWNKNIFYSLFLENGKACPTTPLFSNKIFFSYHKNNELINCDEDKNNYCEIKEVKIDNIIAKQIIREYKIKDDEGNILHKKSKESIQTTIIPYNNIYIYIHYNYIFNMANNLDNNEKIISNYISIYNIIISNLKFIN